MNLKSLPDQHLVEALPDDDGLAFREVYQRYWKKMYLPALPTQTQLDAVVDKIEFKRNAGYR